MFSISYRPRPEIKKDFCRWAGFSGTSRVFSVYGARKVPAYPEAVYIVVKNEGGLAHPVHVARTGAMPDLFFLGDNFRSALKNGGNEVHVHVPAASGCAKTIANDLKTALFAEPSKSPARVGLAA